MMNIEPISCVWEYHFSTDSLLPLADPYTFLVYNETGLFHRDWMTDKIHYSQPGLNDIGKKIAEKIADNRKEK